MLPRWVLAAIGALLALAAWFAWRDTRRGDEYAEAIGGLRAAQTRLDDATLALTAAARTVAVRADTVRIVTNHWRTVVNQPSPVPDTAARSTDVPQLQGYVTQLMQRNLQLVETGNRVERQCTALVNDCELLRTRADSVPDLVRQLRDRTEQAVDAEKPRRRWSPLGCSGPGVAHRDGVGLGVGCGVSYSL